MIGATIKTSGYRVVDPDWRTIAIIGRGLDAPAMIAEAIAADVGCDPDELEFEEEYDRDEPLGQEVARHQGMIVARVILPTA